MTIFPPVHQAKGYQGLRKLLPYLQQRSLNSDICIICATVGPSMSYLPRMSKVTAATGGFKTWGKGETVIRPLKRCQSLLKLRKNTQCFKGLPYWYFGCFKGFPHWMLQMPAPTLISPEAGRGCHTCHTQALQWPPPLFVTIEMILALNSALYIIPPRHHPSHPIPQCYIHLRF